jgi:hypothetical protein
MKFQLPLLFSLVISFFALCPGSKAADTTLDAKALHTLASGHTWRAKFYFSSLTFWSWNPDGSFCLDVNSESGKCDDTGTWKLDGDRLCYKTTWWGQTTGLGAGCIRVVGLDKGGYDAIQDNGMPQYNFSLVK